MLCMPSRRPPASISSAIRDQPPRYRYSGEAYWEAIATLRDALDVPVLGNGDIWEADDALRMVKETGCDGVVVGAAASVAPQGRRLVPQGLPRRIVAAPGDGDVVVADGAG
jgi:2,4-dienoyl-CoA reductase-like NADH-dependent reductase (Old Yellow Enzyme family)